MVRAPALLIALLATAILASSASAAVVSGVKPGDSVLFAVNASSGTLEATKKQNRYVLTLNGVDRRTTWFADRPSRDAGQLATKRLFAGWRRLGFEKEPPNAALAVTGAKARRDTMAVELHLRSYKPKRRSVSFTARRLGALGSALRNLNQRLDQRVARRFGVASLFIDNVSEGQCQFGQPTLLARGSNYADAPVEDMLPADGRLLKVRSNLPLFSIYGNFYGGDGSTTFALPDLKGPVDGTGWYVCTKGIFPTSENIGGLCPVGEVDFFALPNFPASSIDDPDWLPADGRTVAAASYPAYASVYGQTNGSITLPSASPPPGLTSYVCVDGPGTANPYLGELALYPALPAGSLASVWHSADGSSLPLNGHQSLAAILGEIGGATFALPNVLPTGVTGAAWHVGTQGVWPYR